MPQSLTRWITLCGVLVVFLSGCSRDQQFRSGFATDSQTHASQMAKAQKVTIDPASYSGDVVFKLDNEFSTAKGQLPLVLYLGVAAESKTRIQLNAFVDLRQIQSRLPDLVTGVIDETCDRRIELDLTNIRSEADAVRARGVIQVTFFNCNETQALSGDQGVTRFSQTVDAEAVISGRLEEDCVFFELQELDLQSRGVWSFFTSLVFSSESTRKAVLTKVNSFLSDNPVCPELPAELSALSPRFYSGSMREIGQGGIGAEMSGSIDISAPALIQLLTAIQDRGLLEGQT